MSTDCKMFDSPNCCQFKRVEIVNLSKKKKSVFFYCRKRCVEPSTICLKNSFFPSKFDRIKKQNSSPSNSYIFRSFHSSFVQHLHNDIVQANTYGIFDRSIQTFFVIVKSAHFIFYPGVGGGGRQMRNQYF